MENQDQPTLNWNCAITKKETQMAFGYMNGEPTAVFFTESNDEPKLSIDQDTLFVAYASGWPDSPGRVSKYVEELEKLCTKFDPTKLSEIQSKYFSEKDGE